MAVNSFLTPDELAALGLNQYGQNVHISRKASFYSPENISLGDNVRIDDFCILSGRISIGNYVHISAYAAIYAREKVIIGNYCGLSPRATIFSAMDDFSGDYLIGPMVPEEKIKLITGPVILENYVQIGASALVFPGIKILEGSVVGALSLVNKNLQAWGIYAGIPAKKIRDRKMEILKHV